MLTFVGALVVFGTFVFKEALRENFKDLGDSVEKGETLYTLRVDISTATYTSEIRLLSERIIDGISRERDMAVGELIRRKRTPKDTAGALLGIGRVFEALSAKGPTFYRDLDAVGRAENEKEKQLLLVADELAKKMSPVVGKRFEQSASGIAKELDFIQYRIEDCYREADSLPVIPVEDKPSPSDLDGMLKHAKVYVRCAKLSDDHRGLLQKADTEITGLLAAARGLEQLEAERYRLSTWIAYILYAVGWSLGLAGRLVGVEGIAEGAE